MKRKQFEYETRNHVVVKEDNWFIVFDRPYDNDAQGYLEVYESVSLEDCIEWLKNNEFKIASPEDNLPELIVCAANKDPKSGVVYPCVRHGCEIFWKLIDDKYNDLNKSCIHFEEGFLTNKYRFVDRYEAYKIATEHHQIRRGCPTISQRLYSEMLY